MNFFVSTCHLAVHLPMCLLVCQILGPSSCLCINLQIFLSPCLSIYFPACIRAYLCTYRFSCQLLCQLVYLSVCLSACLSVLSVCLTIYVLVHLTACLLVHLPVSTCRYYRYSPICLSTCESVCLFVCLFGYSSIG